MIFDDDFDDDGDFDDFEDGGGKVVESGSVFGRKEGVGGFCLVGL